CGPAITTDLSSLNPSRPKNCLAASTSLTTMVTWSKCLIMAFAPLGNQRILTSITAGKGVEYRLLSDQIASLPIVDTNLGHERSAHPQIFTSRRISGAKALFVNAIDEAFLFQFHHDAIVDNFIDF